MVVGELAHERDVVIIGGGPGGYHAAIRAAQLGKSVTLIEKEHLGGVCLNKGCIPSKVFTESAKKLTSVKDFSNFGIEGVNPTFHLRKLIDYKNKVVEQLRKGVESLCSANKIELITGHAFFLSEFKIGVESGDQYEIYRFKQAIIATGCSPYISNKFTNVEGNVLLNPWTITSLEEFPESLIVYGSDYIALEMAMSFHSFGVEVTLVLDDQKEDLPFDDNINRELLRIFKKSKIKVIKGAQVMDASSISDDCTLDLVVKGEPVQAKASKLFISSSYAPNSKELGLERIGVSMNDDGFILTNKHCQTSQSHIFAVGDVTGGPQLAVKAIKEGKVAAEMCAGFSSEADLTFVPIIVKTQPPIAVVGLTEKEALQQGYDVKTGQFSIAGNGYATLIGQKDGLVKVVMDIKTNLLLGMHIIGEGATELISMGTTALEMVARDEDLAFPLYPHPSMNEAILEAVEALKDQAIHASPKKVKEKV
ncbi:dihydrolipoyl dehydrogenase [Bacillus luteolus]|uniref:Dihydrolipoyl dehydrogenase n=1 Tax=Litchfieldia luteola TaxID=682179 RepID=A0ABR9QMI3_9BACI|nr:dihydrolipoyl dehydrogenase [Cytobacillus luteolus]MBE4909702.1 dihydrolipoyl dehydrogenase [Cytobacillus luteolus]MBP1941258.1 dihydrolipoamide dehydrogenase [Cytobacillus luteolus]